MANWKAYHWEQQSKKVFQTDTKISLFTSRHTIKYGYFQMGDACISGAQQISVLGKNPISNYAEKELL